MALRLIELFIPQGRFEKAKEILKVNGENKILSIWHEHMEENVTMVKILLEAEDAEEILDALEKKFSRFPEFRIIILPVEASVPRPEVKVEQSKNEIAKTENSEKKKTRISREELYSDIKDTTRLSRVYMVMVALSSIVASIGILNNNLAVIIGAMVIAPLLGPNVALSLATTLGDGSLARRALKTNSAGIINALLLSCLIGFFIAVDPEIPELASRTSVGLADIALALASGSAGALAFTAGISTTLIGVMVAVALLPPLVTLGILLGSGYYQLAMGAMLLLLTNIICINLAGVVTFLSQGIRPLTWWEASKAKKAAHNAIIFWIFLLAILVIIILYSQIG